MDLMQCFRLCYSGVAGAGKLKFIVATDRLIEVLEFQINLFDSMPDIVVLYLSGLKDRTFLDIKPIKT